MIDGPAGVTLAQSRSSEARAALDELKDALDICLGELSDARRRATELSAQHDDGKSWTAMAADEAPR
ncbi:hypothetical protein [Paractinoplanes durhamensis]|uniref:hypothetical protein n=1 Tax=Paractinoplanes durhamensis TaxID=113563 RepID=UPI0036291074